MKTPIFKAFLSLSILASFTFCSKKAETCNDGIKNQNETLADCGGDCKPCGTCSDGILNQDETGIDCGGVCSKCQTCSDGIQNQGELGIDCGGPCDKCPILYPVSGNFGPNFGKKDTSAITSSGDIHNTQNYIYYSLRAELPTATSLKVIMRKKGAGVWLYTLGTQQGWSVNQYNSTDNSQTFLSSAGINDVRIFFADHGSASIEFYENNSASPGRVKEITW